MPAKKPKSQHRIPIIITCSFSQKEQIDQVLSRYPVRYRSKYVIDLLNKAIASEQTSITEKIDRGGLSTQFQISCLPEQKKAIDRYCSKHLPPNKRSRWIVQRLLNLFIDK